MTEAKPYADIKLVADALILDDQAEAADRLLNAHRGIFNGTELYMTWMWHLRQVLRIKTLSPETRKTAETALARLKKEFG